MKRLNHKGISLIETIASMVILSFVLAATLTIIVNIRKQSLAANEKINAIEIGTLIRDNIEEEVTYDELILWLDQDKTISNANCIVSSAPFSCDIFQETLDGKDYQDIIQITFFQPSAQDLEYGVIHFSITITYFSIRTMELVGIIYG
ncbi:MAG: type II secretion system protein [Bacilli bacterium]|nr:type II secretion system protein [Bacilli bacterium]